MYRIWFLWLGILSEWNRTYFAWLAILWFYIFIYCCWEPWNMDHVPIPLVLFLKPECLCLLQFEAFARQISSQSLFDFWVPPWISRQGFDHHHAAFERQSHVMVRTVVLSTQQPPGFHWSKPRGTVLHRLWRMLQWQVMCDSVDSVHVDFRFASQRKRVQKKGGKKNISSVRWVSSRVQRQNLAPGCWFTMFELFLDGLIFQFLQVWCSIQICSFEPCSFLF